MKNAKQIQPENGKLILAYGEVTFHSHAAQAIPGNALYELDGQRYLETTDGTTITHEEHKPVQVPPGEYMIGIVREYDHFAEEAREVMD